DPGERRPHRLRDLRRAHAERAGEAAVQLDDEFGLLSTRGQADVYGTGHGAHRVRHGFRDARELAGIRTAQLQLDLLVRTAHVAGEDGVRRAADAAHLVAQRLADL